MHSRANAIIIIRCMLLLLKVGIYGTNHLRGLLIYIVHVDTCAGIFSLFAPVEQVDKAFNYL